MATARSVGARTAAGLLVTVGVCLSATAIASSSQLAGPGHARVRGTGPARRAAPLAQPRSAPAPAVAVTAPAAAGGTSAPGTAGGPGRPTRHPPPPAAARGAPPA